MTRGVKTDGKDDKAADAVEGTPIRAIRAGSTHAREVLLQGACYAHNLSSCYCYCSEQTWGLELGCELAAELFSLWCYFSLL